MSDPIKPSEQELKAAEAFLKAQAALTPYEAVGIL